ncbi:MAG: type II toxin-antitoxin system HicB family antitoxin [Candidatus Hydrogenedentes bacterium]|nr:type II toxin-antitoxin system HicB family antitoxin [Candidatus Hydrogenedentota bacterium]
MGKLAYRIHLEPEPEGGFTVTVPSLPGCVTWGEDYEHAMAMAKEAIEGHIEVLSELGQPVPQESFAEPIDVVVEVTTPAAV